MKKIIFSLFFVFFFLIFLSAFSQGMQETITFTTYYPSPIGSYQDFLVSGRMVVGDFDGDGLVTTADLPITLTDPADPLSDPLPGVLAVSQRLGVGTNDPQSRVHIRGALLVEGGNGDINDNGNITPFEILAIINCINANNCRTALGEEGFLAADVTGDGRVDPKDLVAIIGRINECATLDIVDCVVPSNYKTLSDYIEVIGGAIELNARPQTVSPSGLIFPAGGVSIVRGTVGNLNLDNYPASLLTVNGDIQMGNSDDNCGWQKRGALRWRTEIGPPIINQLEFCDGSATGWQAVVGPRSIRGSVLSDGTIASGSGFTSVHTATGIFDITFDTAFSAVPVAVVNSNTANIAYPSQVLTTGLTINVEDFAGTAVDSQIYFIVVEN